MKGRWIWVKDVEETENQKGCFAAFFKKEDGEEDVTVKICASTRYVLYLNGAEIGRGPIRSYRKIGYYDEYNLEGNLEEENFLAVRVWSYGWSTYQSLAAPGGLWFEVWQGERVLLCSGCDTYGALDAGHQSYAPKRNVNLGFTDYYDGRAFDSMWMKHPKTCHVFPKAEEKEEIWEELKKNPLRGFQEKDQYPVKVWGIQEVERGCQQLSINTRRAFFGDRRDADETIFSGFVGFRFVSPRAMEGRITFPNRTWNGLLGDFKIDERLYHVTNQNRDIQVSVKEGINFFIMQLSGKFDDLYCHMEWTFPEKIHLFSEEGKEVFVAGPTQRIIPVIDGFSKVYGGLKEFNRMEKETDAHLRLAAQDSFDTFCQCCREEQIPFSWVEEKDYYWDAYLLSTSRTDKVVKEEAILEENRGILWRNNRDTVIPKGENGKDKRIIVDFGDIYVGSFEFLIKAGEGTILDIYCYENEYGGEIDYTIGLNNGMRYICRDGWQQYCAMVRMGARYAMITIRNAGEDVRIRDFHLKTRTFACAREGDFSCSDELLNRIYKMCVHTHELCLEDTFTDCPTYEQAFWLGDAKMTEKVNMYVSGDYSLIKRNLLFGATAENNTKLFNALTPTDWNTSIPMWMMNWILSIEEYWDVAEDDSLAVELYQNIVRVLDYYRGFITEEGAFLIYAWNMMDWADMDIDNYGVVTGQQAILAYCYRIAEKIAKWMGEEAKAGEYQETARRLLEYMDRELWDEAGGRYLDGWTPKDGLSKTSSIQTHVLLYFYDGICSEEKRKITEKYLIDPPADFVKAGSPFMLYYVHECLAKFGRSDQVLEEIKEKWGEMLRYDSTTCWEVFPGFYENSRTRSYCQSWSAAPVIFLTEEILGIKRTGRGFHQVKLVVSGNAVSWCRGAMPTPYGAIRVQWDRKTGEYRIWIPKEIEADTKDLKDWNVTVTVV